MRWWCQQEECSGVERGCGCDSSLQWGRRHRASPVLQWKRRYVGGGWSRPAGQGLKSRDQLGWSVAKASHTIGPVQTDAMILGAFEGSSMTLQDHTSYWKAATLFFNTQIKMGKQRPDFSDARNLCCSHKSWPIFLFIPPGVRRERKPSKVVKIIIARSRFWAALMLNTILNFDQGEKKKKPWYLNIKCQNMKQI